MEIKSTVTGRYSGSVINSHRAQYLRTELCNQIKAWQATVCYFCTKYSRNGDLTSLTL